MAFPTPDPQSLQGPRIPTAAKLLLVGVAVASFVLAHYLINQHQQRPAATTGGEWGNPSTPGAGGVTEIGIAYGTEKRGWLEWAAAEFAKSPDGANIKVNLKPMGSQEGAQAIVRGDDAAKAIHVWCPASSLYKEIFVNDWQSKYGSTPIAFEDQIALTPMVFVFWQERYDAFLKKYGSVTFDAISSALREKTGWDAIAGQPDWGLFKFGHTHPNKSNSGLVTLTLMAYEHQHKSSGLTPADIVNRSFQEWMQQTEQAIDTKQESTGYLIKDMILKGPSTYDGLFVYESVAIEQFKNASGRWQNLRVIYPRQNLWSDNPYYALETPWSSPAQKEAARKFLQFLLSERVQQEALVHGFRPANVNVPIKFPQSPFELFQANGLKVDLGTVCPPPSAEVITNLLTGWQRALGGK